MRPQKSDLTVYVFVLAAMLSGAWLTEQFGTTWSPTLLALVGVVAALWTVYHRIAVTPRIGPDRGGTEGQRGEGTTAGDADASAGNDA